MFTRLLELNRQNMNGLDSQSEREMAVSCGPVAGELLGEGEADLLVGRWEVIV